MDFNQNRVSSLVNDRMSSDLPPGNDNNLQSYQADMNHSKVFQQNSINQIFNLRSSNLK